MKTEVLPVAGYERVIYGEDPSTGLKAIIAIHHTGRGPSCGGIRMLPYATREEAMQDVLRLAKGMSYKSSLAQLGFGGGKSVILLDPAKKTPALFHAFGELLNTLDGKYIAAKDMNITSPDLLEVKKKSRHVLGIEGEPGSSGDPSPVTARGVLRALEATVEHLTGSRNLQGMKIAIQGIGHVGYGVAELVSKAGAEIWVTDIDEAALQRAKQELGAHVVPLDAILDVKCDIFSPCARGAILNEKSIPRLQCRAVVGAANNQLFTPADGMRLHEREILYVPDYAVNAGGIINIFIEHENGTYDEAKALHKADAIYGTIKEILKRSVAEKKAPFIVADTLAEERLNERHH